MTNTESELTSVEIKELAILKGEQFSVSDDYGFTIDLNFKMDFESIRNGAAFCTPHFKTSFRQHIFD